MENTQRILTFLQENRQRRQHVLSSALREEEEWDLARLQREIIELQDLYQQLKQEAYDMKLTRDGQLSALSKRIAEFEQNQTQVQAASAIPETFGDIKVQHLEKRLSASEDWRDGCDVVGPVIEERSVQTLLKLQESQQECLQQMKYMLERLASQEAELDTMRQTFATHSQQCGSTSLATSLSEDSKAPQESTDPIFESETEVGKAFTIGKASGDPIQQSTWSKQKEESLAVHDAAVKQSSDSSRTTSSATENLAAREQMEDRVTFEESIWDTPMFIGLGLSFTEDFQILFVFVLNIFVQIIYTYIIGAYLAENDDLQRDLQGLKSWRLHYGHSFQYESQGRSLVARVCDGSTDLEVSGHHSNYVTLINQYIHFSSAFGVGPVLFCIAIYCWTLAVADELHHTLRLMERLGQLPHAACTEIVQTSNGDKQLRALNSFRRVSFIVVLLIRGGIAGFILIFGIQWLARTVAVEELVLNAVALEVVFSLDERVYVTLVPVVLREFIACGICIPKGKASLIHNHHYNHHSSRVMLVFTFCILGISIPLWLVPAISSLHDARSVLCSGNLDFVVTRTRVHPFFGWSQTSPVRTDAEEEEVPMRNVWEDDPEWDYFDYVSANIIRAPSFDEAALQNSAVQVTQFSNLYGTPGSLATVSLQTSSMANYLTNKKCRDATARDFSNDGWYAMISELKHISNLPKPCNHTHWVWACDQPDRAGEMARLFCPETCGCNTPASAQVLSGCPEQCVMTVAWKIDIEAKHCCTDSDQNHLLNSTIWSSTVTNFNNSRYAYRGAVSNLIKIAAQSLSTLGCDGLSDVRERIGLDLCDDGANLPGLMQFRYWCPLACYCTEATKGCPMLHIDDHDLQESVQEAVSTSLVGDTPDVPFTDWSMGGGHNITTTLPEAPPDEDMMLPEELMAPMPEAPLAPLPEAPLGSIPEAPIEEAPLGSTPDVPFTDWSMGGGNFTTTLPEAPPAEDTMLPEALMAPMPEAPLAPLPEAPLGSIPEAPIEEAPLGSIQEAPIPEAPLGSIPEAPLGSIPEAPLGSNSTKPDGAATREDAKSEENMLSNNTHRFSSRQVANSTEPDGAATTEEVIIEGIAINSFEPRSGEGSNTTGPD